jgi:hypothetical protein
VAALAAATPEAVAAALGDISLQLSATYNLGAQQLLAKPDTTS